MYTTIQKSGIGIGLHDKSHVIVMRISSVKPILWLVVNLITCFQMEWHLIHAMQYHVHNCWWISFYYEHDIA